MLGRWEGTEQEQRLFICPSATVQAVASGSISKAEPYDRLSPKSTRKSSSAVHQLTMLGAEQALSAHVVAMRLKASLGNQVRHSGTSELQHLNQVSNSFGVLLRCREKQDIRVTSFFDTSDS